MTVSFDLGSARCGPGPPTSHPRTGANIGRPEPARRAIEHDLDDEAELAFHPTAGDSWLLSLPAAGADVEIARAAVAAAAHVEVREVA
jgi:hypothetical protein